MKKRISLLIATFLIHTGSFAQGEKGFIGISLGPSIPTGDFASKDADNDAAGWANSGAIFDISFAYRLGEGNFGITALLRGQYNPTDAQALADEMANQFPNIYWGVESDGWGIGGLLFGGFGSFPVSEKVNFEPRAMFGFLSATSPEITIRGSDGSGGSAWVKTSSAEGSSVAYLIGAGFRFNVGERLSILTNLDYLGANPEFSNVETTTSFGIRSVDTWSQSYGSINFGFGLALRI